MTDIRSQTLRRIWNLGLEGAKFGGVGLAATAAHVTIFSVLIEFWNITPMKANAIAFCMAFWISFFGHFYWTFAGGEDARRSLGNAGIRFVFVALTGFALNSLVVYVVDHVLRLPYVYAILGMIFIVPLVLFLMSRYWAFNTIERRPGASG
jgi:putative flippase GtrA